MELKRYSCDVSYVSHASQTPRAFHEEERRAYTDPTIHRLLETMFELTPSSIAASGVMTGAAAVRVINEASRLTGIEVGNAELRSRFIEWYLWRLGDRLFRHQALEWVAEWARQSGRRFRIYGHGWDAHPTLREFAVGPAANGRELLCVYRASKINLQLMPAGFVHQRALDGLVGGGFFLSHRTPHDHSGRTLRRLDNRIGELDIRSTRELLETDDVALQSLLHEYMGEALREVDENSQQLYLRLRGQAELVHPDEVFPDFDEILFGSAREFQAKADHFIADDAARQRIAETMRQVVVEYYSYRPTMDRFLQKMGAWFRESGS